MSESSQPSQSRKKIIIIIGLRSFFEFQNKILLRIIFFNTTNDPLSATTATTIATMPAQTNHHYRSLVGSISFLVTIALGFAIVVSIMVPNHQQSASALSSQQPLYPNRKIALVTGSNKGIGYEIAKKLLSHENGDAFVCILGCRNQGLGRTSADKLVSETKNSCVDVVKIDLMDHDSITKAVEYIQATYGRCDVLINNAAVCYNDPTLYGAVSHTPFAQQAETTIATNFFGTLALTRAMLPLLLHQSGAEDSNLTSTTPRIINIASSAGRLSIIPSNEKKKALSSESLTVEDLETLMKDFVQAAKDGKHSSEGWPNTGYGVSKVGIIAMTKILARHYFGKKSDSDDGDSTTTSVRRMMVNSVDPGYCATDQNNNQGVIPAELGAVTPYLLATLNDDGDSNNGFTGKHWYQEREIEW